MFLASATVTHGGGGNDDPSAWNVDMNVSGAKTNSATEVFPTGVIRVIYSPTAAPAAAGYDEAKEHIADGA